MIVFLKALAIVVLTLIAIIKVNMWISFKKGKKNWAKHFAYLETQESIDNANDAIECAKKYKENVLKFPYVE